MTAQKVYRIPIYRWRCAGCGATVSVLPDFLAPYAQFVSFIREGVMRRRLAGWPVAKITARACLAAVGGLSPRTVFRWLARAREGATEWTKVLSDLLLLMQPGFDLFRLSSSWRGPHALLQSLCELGDLCRRQVHSDQSHAGLYAYCNGLLTELPRL